MRIIYKFSQKITERFHLSVSYTERSRYCFRMCLFAYLCAYLQCLSAVTLKFNPRDVPNVLDWQTWRRQLNHTGVDSDFTAKCIANVFTLL